MEKLLNEEWALDIAAQYGLKQEVQECINAGLTPTQALKEWDIL